MKSPDIKLPSNKKFGIFFTTVFVIVTVYLLQDGLSAIACFFAGLAAIFSGLAFIKPEALLPMNRLWMHFGMVLGRIVSPVILGLIFFIIFTPAGLLMRLSGRDELRLKVKSASSYWKERQSGEPSGESFKLQF